MRGLGYILGSLKHHVLEQVRKARPAFTLISRAHIVINRDGNYRDRMVLVQNDAKTVIQTELFDRCVWNLERFLHK